MIDAAGTGGSLEVSRVAEGGWYRFVMLMLFMEMVYHSVGSPSAELSSLVNEVVSSANVAIP